MKKNKLIEIIRIVVAEEVQKQLPKVVSEMYLKKLVSESIGQNWEDSFDAELQRASQKAPEPLENSDEGIYQRGGTIRRKNEAITNRIMANSKLLSEDNKLSHLYEGVTPISNDITQPPAQPSVQTDVPLETFGITPGKYSGVNFDKKSDKAPIKQSVEAEERRIANMRAMLDQKVV